ncbi:MAG: sugar phosphate isomerase/epimerase family protein [Bryobacteraceae bacterium]
MKELDTATASSRRAFLAGALTSAGAPSVPKQYAPRIVCNMWYWTQLFSTPFRYISSTTHPLKAPPGQKLAEPTGGYEWSDAQWYTALSDAQWAGYKRIEMVTTTVAYRSLDFILSLLKQYGLVVNHIYYGGTLYPRQVAERTIGNIVAELDRCKPLKSSECLLDSWGAQSDDDRRTYYRSLDRLGREAADRGMKLCIHNHEGPMRNNAPEWHGVLQNTDPALVSMCLDMDWAWQAGTDPFPLLYKAGDQGRLGAVHMRTQRNKLADQTMEDGGDIDFHKVAGYLKKIRFDGALVEETEWMQDTKVTRSARENKRLARIWCERVFGVPAAK